MIPNIKEKVLKEVLFKVKFTPVLNPKQFEKLYEVINLTLTERKKEEKQVIDDLEHDENEDGFHPVEKVVNSRELKQKLGIK